MESRFGFYSYQNILNKKMLRQYIFSNKKIEGFTVFLRFLPITQKQGAADHNSFQIRILHRKIYSI